MVYLRLYKSYYLLEKLKKIVVINKSKIFQDSKKNIRTYSRIRLFKGIESLFSNKYSI